eukprot:COSAG05_NODE_747_length_7566_cov_10.990759_5_plen_212_part_00
MIRSPHDGAHLAAPQAQSGSSARVLSATSGNTPRETASTRVAIPGPSLIVTTTEGDLAANQPNPAARSAGATTSGSEAVNEDSEDMPNLTDGRLSIRAEAVVDTKDLRELTGNRHRPDPEHERHLRERGDADTLATHLLGRDDTQSAPNPQRNASEASSPKSEDSVLREGIDVAIWRYTCIWYRYLFGTWQSRLCCSLAHTFMVHDRCERV